jgi:hypothetical protein
MVRTAAKREHDPMTNALNPSPSPQMFVKHPLITGTVQQGTGGYVLPQQLTALLPHVFDAGHLLPSKELSGQPIQTPATRANVMNFFLSNLQLWFPGLKFKTDKTQGAAENETSPK